MKQRVVWGLLGVALLAAGCARAGEGPSLVTGRPDGQGASFEVLAVGDDVPVGEMVAADTSGDGDGVLVLVAAGIESLTVRWDGTFAPAAAGFRLQWRLRPAPEGEELVWWAVDLDASVRTYEITGLTAGTRYRLRLTALDADGGDGEFAVAGFETLAPPVRNLSATAVAHDAVRVAWDGPAGWSPVGYVVQWRLRGPNEFLGRLELPAGRRSQLVTGLAGGTEHVFRLTARTAAGWQSEPAAVGVTTPAAPAGDLTLEISAPRHCTAQEGPSAGYGWGGPVEDEYWVHEGVASVPVQWRISGGQGPYVVRVAGIETQGAAGTTEVTCAKAGIDLNNLKDPDIDVVESGPKTITIEATDATGATTTRIHTFEVIERVGSAGSFYDGIFLIPGRTYYNWGRFFETPEGEHIAYMGPVQAHLTDGGSTEIAEFRHVVGGARDTTAWFDIFSGELRGRWPIDETKGPHGDIDFNSLITLEERAVWDVFFASMRHTPFPEGDPRNEPPIPLATEPGGATSARQLAISAVCVDRRDCQVMNMCPYGIAGSAASRSDEDPPRIEWAFAAWGRTVTDYQPQHGGPVNIAPGDLIVSYGQPYTSFADSPFNPSSFASVSVQYGDTTITATSCDTHFWNNGRYECHVRGAFTWDAANIPAEVTINRAAATGTPTTRTSRADAKQDRASDGLPTPPTTYLTTCPTWSNLNCGQAAPTDQRPPNPAKN